MDKSMLLKSEIFNLVATAFATSGLNFMSFSIALGYGIIKRILGKD